MSHAQNHALCQCKRGERECSLRGEGKEPMRNDMRTRAALSCCPKGSM